MLAGVVGTTRFELVTSSMSRKRSNQLSYAPASIKLMVKPGFNLMFADYWPIKRPAIIVMRLSNYKE